MHIGEEIPNPYSGMNGLGDDSEYGLHGPVFWGSIFGVAGLILGSRKDRVERAVKWATLGAFVSYSVKLVVKGRQ